MAVDLHDIKLRLQVAKVQLGAVKPPEDAVSKLNFDSAMEYIQSSIDDLDKLVDDGK